MTKFRPKLSSRVDPAKLGIETESDELKKINEATDENGVVDLAEVYDVPADADVSKQKTVLKYMEKDGLEYGEKQYKKEYQLKAAHQIMINGGSTAQVAQALNVSVGEAKNIQRELAARQLREIKNLDPQQEIAKAYMFYDHVAAKALQLANKTTEKSLRSQIEALRVALQAQTDKQKFLTNVGAYTAGLKGDQENSRPISEANEMRDMLDTVMRGDGTYEVVPEEVEEDDGVSVL